MRTALLLLVILTFSLFARAQYAGNSVVFHKLPAGGTAIPGHTAAKNTGGMYESWFDYVAVMATDSAAGWYRTMYNDSTVTEYDSSIAQYIAVHDHGAGFSFDPYAHVWDSGFVNINEIPGFVLQKTESYEVDSVYIAGRYNRKAYNNYTDTLLIDMARTGSAGAFFLQSGPDTSWAANTADSMLRIFTAVYDADNNKLSDSVGAISLVRLKIPLGAAFFADSLPDGSHSRALKIPGNLYVTANEGIVTYLHYKSGHVYPPGTPADSVNTWQQLYYELNGPGSTPYQQAKERNTGLVSTSQSRYSPYFTPYQGHKMLIPTPYYNSAATNDWPCFAFYVKCILCQEAVHDINNIISNVGAFPNPATDELHIAVTTVRNIPVSVSLINVSGQTVASRTLDIAGRQTIVFPAVQLPAGVYRYVVRAGSTQSGGNVVVVH